jgi:hypothetical protein
MPAPAYAVTRPSESNWALRIIDELEHFDRGRYAGPVGWVELLQLVDDAQRVGRRRAGHGRGRMQRLDQVERGRAVGEFTLDVAREVPDIRKLEREWHLARHDVRAVRPQRREHVLHGIPVFVLVLGRDREGRRRLLVGCRVESPSGAPGEHARRHRPRIDAHEGLRARADEPVDREGPAVGVAEGERLDHAADVRTRRQLPDEFPREHDLADLAVTDATDRRRHGIPVVLTGQRARPQVHMEALAVGGERRDVERVEGSSGDSGDPALALVAPEDERRHDQHASGRGVVGEREGPEGEQSGAGLGERVGHRRGGDDPLPGGHGIRHAIGTTELEAQRLAESDEAEAASHPEQRMPRLQHGHERPEIDRRRGLDGQGWHGGRAMQELRTDHPANTIPARRRPVMHRIAELDLTRGKGRSD